MKSILDKKWFSSISLYRFIDPKAGGKSSEVCCDMDVMVSGGCLFNLRLTVSPSAFAVIDVLCHQRPQ